ncbi:MAG: ROK family protein, partial [Bifidobacteriaceae bacterium]|nr:ROK family protein [Bifidobacteriaceae bacterium]
MSVSDGLPGGAGMATQLSVPAGASQGSLRRHNLRLVYQAVARAADPLSRAQLGALVGGSRATASALVDALIAGRLLEELDVRSSGRAGRPATPVRVARGTLAGLGLEINVDYVAAQAVDLAGEVLVELVEPASPGDGTPDAAARDLAAAASQVVGELSRRDIPVVGATVAVPGPVDRTTGILRSAPNLGWGPVDLLPLLREESGLDPLGIDNEATLAARAELAAGGDPSATFLYISGGVGIGGGIVQGGALQTGCHGWAGELGHVTVDTSGPPCACGSNGCLEQYAGRRAILAAAGATPEGSGGGRLSALLAEK